MSQLRWEFKTDNAPCSNTLSRGDQIGSRQMSPEDLEESPQPEKLSIPGEFQDKGTPSSPPSIILSHIPDTPPSTQLFTGLHLAEMEKIFEEGIGSSRAMNLETFIRSMKKVLSDVSNEMLETLFFKVDSDGNGFITWPKYMDYVMHEFQGLEEMRRSQYRLRFHLPMQIIPLRRGCEIVKVEFLIQRFKKIGRFLTVTRDGVLQFWSESFLPISSFRLRKLHNQQMWVIDLVCLHNMNLIAVSSTELKIEFFDISNYKCVRAFTFTELDSCILVMDYWSDYHKGVFCLGDTKGNVIIFTSDNVASGLFNPHILPRISKWDHWVSVSMQKLLNEKSILYRSYCLPIGILKGYLEAHGPTKLGKTTTHNSALCAVLYSKIFKQVLSGCQQGTVSVWEIVTGRKMMEFSVSGAQLVELTAMALDTYERCLLTGLLDGTMKMWNYNTGECLLTFPNPDQVEISGIVHMNKVYYMTGWSKRITSFMFHKTKPVLLCHHWQTFHMEDVLCMAKYQNQFLGTSSYNGDILFWNVNMLKPILNFNASVSPLPLQPVKVEEAEVCVDSSQGLSKTCVEKMWAHKASERLPCPGRRTSHRRTLMSAPVGMKHSGSKEPERPLSQQICFSTGRSKSSNRYLDKGSFYKETEMRRKEPQKKMLLQSNASVEKIIFLQTRPRLPHTAAMLSSCINGYIYACSIHGNGGLLGKFPVDLEDNGDVVGAMATDENDWILITGDCKGRIKIWDIKDYCTFVGHRLPQSSGVKIPTETENKFRFLIPDRLQTSIPYYIPLQEKEISPQVYQSLYFNELTPVGQPDFLMHRAPDPQGQGGCWVAHNIQKDLESVRKQIFADASANTLDATPSLSPSLSPVASVSRLPDSTFSLPRGPSPLSPSGGPGESP
ncbi:EF-hand calcium-binding domain-containing protein 8 isoform X9 [Fukomys damarensis]|uniref:EF-hand calcium-binding domain-containing protein 8 isoform X9 n=1 Tax=Fukomys damarensis TaxID=885580 RepID=UPI00145556EC|nr:EF-hand calcium-binding domain-containing protein 8 isoform X9 [Fukomys damarensis]